MIRLEFETTRDFINWLLSDDTQQLIYVLREHKSEDVLQWM